jgi:hypothetical protein
MSLEELLCVQGQWRWCGKCEGLFFAGPGRGPARKGRCPAGGVHDDSASGEYTLMHQVPGLGQGGWHWCGKCEGLFFAGTEFPGLARVGKCAAGGVHDGSASGEYTLMHEVPGVGQSGWHWCGKCEGLFFAGTEFPGLARVGKCPAGGVHDDSASGEYGLVNWCPRHITRADWAAVPPTAPGRAVPIDVRKEYFVHFTDGPTNQAVRTIQNDHMVLRSSRGLQNLSDIGYNFLVDVDGNVYEGRGRDVEGAHCRGHNTSGIGVAFIGRDGDSTPQARWSLRRLWECLAAAAGHRLVVLGHRDVEQNPDKGRCPGDDLYGWLQQAMPLR